MCGIAAIVRPHGEPVASAPLAAMVRALSHRGPDGLAMAKVGGGHVGLGHARLAIMDPAHGQQPLWSADGTMCIVANGELYDHRAWRRELERDGHRFGTDSDSEVLLALYARDGLACLPRLNGELAFVIWDGRERRVVASRDRLGVKPLHVARVGRDVYLASEALAILATGALEPRLSAEYLSGPFLGVMRADLSAFAGIAMLRPGHWLTIDGAGHVAEGAYWTPELVEDRSLDLGEATRQVRERLERAVRRRLVADVPVAAYLSGGLDSTAVTSLMARELGQVDAFTLAFHEPALDESAEAAATARERGIRLHRVAATPEALAEGLVGTTLALEAPFINVNSIAKRILSAATRDAGYKVVLTGEGADEAFAGYASFKLEALWRELRQGGAAAAAARPLLAEFERAESRSEGSIWRKGLPWDAPTPELGSPLIGLMRVAEAERVYRRLLAPRVLADPACTSPRRSHERELAGVDLAGMTPVNRARRLAISVLQSFIIPKLGDRVEMANGLEARTPFLDPELWELALRLPGEYLLDLPRLREKHVLREAVRDLVPAAALARGKHPFVGPSWRSVRDTRLGRQLFDEHLSLRSLRRAGLIAPFVGLALVTAWRLAPARSRLVARLDPVIGQLLTLHVLAASLPGRIAGLRAATVTVSGDGPG
jgi:asparagine synthase (glutamine-hydrolysing)